MHAVGQLSPCGRVEIRRGRRRRYRRFQRALAEPARRHRRQGAARAGRRRPRAAKPDIPLDEVELLPAIPNPDKILCIGLNYASHVGEVGRQLPTVPSVFSRLHNTLVPHGGNIVRPRASIDFDFEGELAVVIGERCRHVPRASALSVDRGLHLLPRRQRARLPEAFGDRRQELPGDRPARPVDGHGRRDHRSAGAELTTRLNGAEVQHDTTDHMIFDVATIIEYLSTVTWLEPGDIIATGTPDGVGLGRKPPLWMKARRQGRGRDLRDRDFGRQCRRRVNRSTPARRRRRLAAATPR